MTFFDELALKAAEQLESSVGSYIALASYKRLLAAEQPIRGKAVLGALRCAVDLGDEREIEPLADAWTAETSAHADVAPLVSRLFGDRRHRIAMLLAKAELARRPSARASYAVARAIDASAQADAAAAWDRTIDLAAREKDTRVLSAAVARWLEIVLFGTLPPPFMNGVRAAIALRASMVDLENTTPAERLVIAQARLLSPSKFQRASALSVLAELARSGTDAIRRHAVLAAARHVDSMSGRIDPVEVDRAGAALKHWPEESARDAALARLAALEELEAFAKRREESPAKLDDLISRVAKDAPEVEAQAQRVRALLRGGSGGGAHEPSSAVGTIEVRLAGYGIDAVAAMRRDKPAEATTALVRARESLPPIAAVPPALYAASTLALSKRDGALKRAASAFLAHTLERSFGVPPGGFSPIGIALARSGFFREARDAFSEARRLKEPGAAAYLAELERKLAYEAIQRGDRASALDRLRAARELFAEASRGGGRA